MDIHALVILTVAAALIFDVINGFHDAANSIATVVSTRVLSPRVAVLWAATFNFIALFIFHQGVADTIAKTIHIEVSSNGTGLSSIRPATQPGVHGECRLWIAARPGGKS